MSKQSVYEVVTARLIEQLESGVAPWKQPWKNYLDSNTRLPSNYKTKKAYRGINAVLLNGAPTPFWLTYKQAEEMGGQVRKGSKGTPVVYWKWLSAEERAANPDRMPCYPIYSTVFNLSQIDGIELPAEAPVDVESGIAACDRVVAHLPVKAEIRHEGARAFYSPTPDYVNMPKKSAFKALTGYYATLFHELTHWTGHHSRLDRLSKVAHFGSEDYSKEELVAEMGAAFLCAHTGIQNETEPQSASYLASWIRVLKGDSKLALQAASAAQKATDYILGVKQESAN